MRASKTTILRVSLRDRDPAHTDPLRSCSHPPPTSLRPSTSSLAGTQCGGSSKSGYSRPGYGVGLSRSGLSFINVLAK